MQKESITVILTLYKRPHYFKEQLLAIESQKLKPEKIVLFVNNPEILPHLSRDLKGKKVEVIVSSENTYFHGRFAIALCMKTDFVCIFDDDTIPGFGWLENCFHTISETGEAILGTSGIILTEFNYENHQKVGASGIKNEKAMEVDLVGHSWFLKTDTLKYLWYEKPLNYKNGEDISLSYLAQKYGNIPTIVPPHPEKNPSIYGSTKTYYGNDPQASYQRNRINHFRERNELCQTFIKNGWKTVLDLNKKNFYS